MIKKRKRKYEREGKKEIKGEDCYTAEKERLPCCCMAEANPSFNIHKNMNCPLRMPAASYITGQVIFVDGGETSAKKGSQSSMKLLIKFHFLHKYELRTLYTRWTIMPAKKWSFSSHSWLSSCLCLKQSKKV